MRRMQILFAALAVALVTAPVVRAQQQAPPKPAPVTAADLNRLDATADDIDATAAALEKKDPTLAQSVKRALGDLRDEITYMKVKLKKEGAVTRDEYESVRDRLDTLQLKAQGQGKVSAGPVLIPQAGATMGQELVVPVGTTFDVRLQTPLNSGTAKEEQRFEATTMSDLTVAQDVAAPAGSIARGFVSSVRAAGKIDRTGSLTLSFDEMVIDGTPFKLRASVTQALQPKVGDDVTRVGTGAAVGAIIGGLLGGGKGALLGVIIGGGGTIAATEGSDLDLPVGTVLRLRLDQPLDVIR